MPNSLQKILIADDHDIVREAIARVLVADLGAEVRTVADAHAAMLCIQEEGPFSVVLLDINMTGMKGTESIGKIVTANRPGNVVIFSGTTNEDFVARAIEAGARGYIPKTQPLASLADAIRLIVSGTVFVPFTNRSAQRERPTSDGLTDKQRDVLRLVSRGQSNKQIGIELGMTEVTVKMHMRNICNRLGTKNRTQAAMIARDAGLLD
jgi:DNA-binding NarL/FixJ family response regulator